MNDKTVIIIGAGFPLALNYSKTSTSNFLSNAKEITSSLYILQKILNLSPVLCRTPLNYFWEAIDCGFKNTSPPSRESREVLRYLKCIFKCILSKYEEPIRDALEHKNKNKKLPQPYSNLINDIYKRKFSFEEQTFIALGVELKIALLHLLKGKIYKSVQKKFLSKKSEFPHDSTTFISLNYDLCLEEYLENWYYPRWYYPRKNCKFKAKKALYEIIKPHGSLNIKFLTNYKNKENELVFNEQLINPEKVGLENDEEMRPAVIGYISDSNKDELKDEKDAAHKWLSDQKKFAEDKIKKANKIIIIGYSLPKEDEWIRDSIKKSNFERYSVASGEDSESVKLKIEKLKKDKNPQYEKLGCPPFREK